MEFHKYGEKTGDRDRFWESRLPMRQALKWQKRKEAQTPGKIVTLPEYKRDPITGQFDQTANRTGQYQVIAGQVDNELPLPSAEPVFVPDLSPGYWSKSLKPLYQEPDPKKTIWTEIYLYVPWTRPAPTDEPFSTVPTKF